MQWIWIFQVTNKQNLTLEDLDMAKIRETLIEEMSLF